VAALLLDHEAGAVNGGQVPIGETIWGELDPPRRLTLAEQALLTVLTQAVGSQGLGAQVVGAVVCGVCRCGCGSRRLATDAPRLPEEEIRRLTGGRRDDYVNVTAHVRVANQVPPQLTLHVLEGRIAELELYAGDDVAVPLPAPSDLGDVRVGG
jgi:hypothetical protein